MMTKAYRRWTRAGFLSTVAGMVLMGMLFSISLTAAADKGRPHGKIHVVLMSVDPGDVGLGNGEERACRDLDMANMLLRNGQRPTLFLANNGVKLADTSFWNTHTGDDTPQCYERVGDEEDGTPIWDYVSMQPLLEGFIDDGGKVLICPMCWFARLEEGDVDSLIDGAELGDSNSIPTTFIWGKNVISF